MLTSKFNIVHKVWVGVEYRLQEGFDDRQSIRQSLRHSENEEERCDPLVNDSLCFLLWLERLFGRIDPLQHQGFGQVLHRRLSVLQSIQDDSFHVLDSHYTRMARTSRFIISNALFEGMKGEFADRDVDVACPDDKLPNGRFGVTKMGHDCPSYFAVSLVEHKQF